MAKRHYILCAWTLYTNGKARDEELDQRLSGILQGLKHNNISIVSVMVWFVRMRDAGS